MNLINKMLDFKKIEEEILKFWKKNKIYEKSKERNKKGKKFYFLQGPPYTSGRLHIGHAWNNNMKDIALRFFRLKGYNVWDRAGYDMHGLPTANQVQKELNLKDKDEIVKFGVDKFVKRCQEFSMKNAGLMNEDLKRLGIWMDFENAYLPVTNEFMSAEWMFFKKAWEQKRLYKGQKIMPWCRECETSLAKHELEYENLKDESIFLKFKTYDKRYLIIWTTTPWTIPFNLAVMVNPEIKYVEVKIEDEVWIIAKDLVGSLMKLIKKKYKIIDEFKGKKLKGLRYNHPFENEIDYKSLKEKWKNVHTVILSREYVNTESGSGLVHCAPGCGPEDYEVGKKYGIGAFNTLDEKGVFQDFFKGLTAKVDDEKFVDMLDKKRALIAKTSVKHEYATCWRCCKPVIFRATEQWFLKVEDLVKKILDYNKKIKWVPKTVQNNYEAWITNLKDNGVTRQRFWGTPFPVWECGSCKELEVIGSLKELNKKAIDKIPKNLHKPWIDKVKLKCPKCKKEMKRIPDVIDVWIDSGTASWNCLDYPKRKDLFENFFPADLILEASEQARLWFSMLQVCSTIMFGRSSYKGVFGHGMILDFQGTKMSKSLGNIISPYEVIDKYSSEILRYYICETKAGENINFNWEDVKQKQRNLLILGNIANYLVQLKDLISKNKKHKNEIEEKYILSRLNSSIEKTTELFEGYNFDKTITELEKLFLDISRIYIRFTREKSSEKPELVYSVLKEVYVELLKMFSTICPLFTEHIWQKLREKKIVKEDSVHLSSWPKVDKKKIDEELEKNMKIVLNIIEAGLAERDKVKIGLKWPLQIGTVNYYKPLDKKFLEIIKRELNLKEIEYIIGTLAGKGEEISVELDASLTPELEAEGYAREMSRQVQSFRKKLGLEKKDKIELFIFTDDKFKNILETRKDFIKERTNSKKLEIVTTDKERFKNKSEFKIKDKRGEISINKLP